MTPPKTERFEMRMDEDILARIDNWRADEPDVPSRAEAVRRLIEGALRQPVKGMPKPSPYESLTLGMLCEIVRHLKIRTSVEPDHLQAALTGGHYWSLAWQYPGLIHNHADKDENVTAVVDYLDMWSFIENGFKSLKPSDRKRVTTETGRETVQFPGFDGNNESEHYAIARHLIDDLARWANFKGRELNSHMPTLARHSRMYVKFEPMRAKLTGRNLSADEIIELVETWKKM